MTPQTVTAHPSDTPLLPGERVSLRRRLDDGAQSDLVGFVLATEPDALRLVDRRGTAHRVAWPDVVALRRVGVARGRDPLWTPRDLLDELAARADVRGRVFVVRLSDLLADRPPVSSVPAERGRWPVPGGTARCEGEWVTAPAGADLIAVAWWATRQDARSMQVRTDDGEEIRRLLAAGFAEHS